jgi:hypothetical protein
MEDFSLDVFITQWLAIWGASIEKAGRALATDTLVEIGIRTFAYNNLSLHFIRTPIPLSCFGLATKYFPIHVLFTHAVKGYNLAISPNGASPLWNPWIRPPNLLTLLNEAQCFTKPRLTYNVKRNGYSPRCKIERLPGLHEMVESFSIHEAIWLSTRGSVLMILENE